jgi:UDP:flavonoid glycosyltransferase YjiC (YdhE family)
MLRAGGTWTTDLDSLNRTRRTLGLPIAADGLAAWESPELLLVTAPRWFDVALDYPEHVAHAGPLGVVAPTTAAARSRVLLSFSTTVMDGQESLIERAREATADRDAILSSGSDDHDAMMAGCAAVITHGGLGTTLRALAHGLPMLLLPLGRDQHANAARAAELGAGIALAPDSTPAQIRAALDELLDAPGFGRRARELAERIAADRPDERAVAALVSAASS